MNLRFGFSRAIYPEAYMKARFSSASGHLDLTDVSSSPFYVSERIVNRSTVYLDTKPKGVYRRMLLPAPVPHEPLTPQTFDELIAAFFDRVRLATSLDAVNIAAGIAAEAVRQITT